MAGSLMLWDLATQRQAMLSQVQERKKLMFQQMCWVEEQPLLHPFSMLKINSSMKVGVLVTVQLRFAIRQPRRS